MRLKALQADHMMWALTWDHEAREHHDNQAYFNRRTGELMWWFDLKSHRGPDDQNAQILSWPDADRELVPELADEEAAVTWLAERGFAVEWT